MTAVPDLFDELLLKLEAMGTPAVVALNMLSQTDKHFQDLVLSTRKEEYAEKVLECVRTIERVLWGKYSAVAAVIIPFMDNYVQEHGFEVDEDADTIDLTSRIAKIPTKALQIMKREVSKSLHPMMSSRRSFQRFGA